MTKIMTDDTTTPGRGHPEAIGHGPPPIVPSRRPLDAALAGTLTRLGEEAVYRASTRCYDALLRHVPPSDFAEHLGQLQRTLDRWFIGKATSDQTAAALKAASEAIQAAASEEPKEDSPTR